MTTRIQAAFFERQERLNAKLDQGASSSSSQRVPQREQYTKYRNDDVFDLEDDEYLESPGSYFPDSSIIHDSSSLMDSFGSDSMKSPSTVHLPSNFMEQDTVPLLIIKALISVITPMLGIFLIAHTISVPIGIFITSEIAHTIVMWTVISLDVFCAVLYKDVIQIIWPRFDGAEWRNWLLKFTKTLLVNDVNGVGLKLLSYKYNHELVYKCINLVLDHFGCRMVAYSSFVVLGWSLIFIALGFLYSYQSKGSWGNCWNLIWAYKWYVSLVVDLMILYSWTYKRWLTG